MEQQSHMQALLSQNVLGFFPEELEKMLLTLFILLMTFTRQPPFFKQV